MATKKQINANRKNAMKSTGPKTPEGKKASRRNAQSHGLFAKDVVAAGEDRDLYDALLGALHAEHRPDSLTETLLVERLALAFWREQRLARAERMMMDSSVRVHKLKGGASGLGLPYEPRQVLVGIALAEVGMLTIQDQLLIGRYQTMISNQIRLALKDLREEKSLREKTIDGASYVEIADDADDEPLA